MRNPSTVANAMLDLLREGLIAVAGALLNDVELVAVVSLVDDNHAAAHLPHLRAYTAHKPTHSIHTHTVYRQ